MTEITVQLKELDIPIREGIVGHVEGNTFVLVDMDKLSIPLGIKKELWEEDV